MPGIKITIKKLIKNDCLGYGSMSQGNSIVLFGIFLDAGHQNNEKKPIKNDCFGGRAAGLTCFKKGVSITPQFVMEPKFFNTFSWNVSSYMFLR